MNFSSPMRLELGSSSTPSFEAFFKEDQLPVGKDLFGTLFNVINQEPKPEPVPVSGIIKFGENVFATLINAVGKQHFAPPAPPTMHDAIITALLSAKKPKVTPPVDPMGVAPMDTSED